jgi:hypothetical protein
MLIMEENSLYFSVNIQSVATGNKCIDRNIAYICLADDKENIIYKSTIKPETKILTTIFPYTGLTISDFDKAKTINEIVEDLKKIITRDTILVGQASFEVFKKEFNIFNIDYNKYISLSDLFKVANTKGTTKFSYQYFTLEIECLALLNKNIDKFGENNTKRAIAISSLYKAFLDNKIKIDNETEILLRRCYKSQPPSFASINSKYEDVCMGHIQSGKNGYSCPCGTRTKTNRSW